MPTIPNQPVAERPGADPPDTTPRQQPILARISLRGRLTAWLLLLLLAQSAAILGVTYWAFGDTTIQHLDAHVEEEMIEFRNIAGTADPAAGWRRIVELESR